MRGVKRASRGKPCAPELGNASFFISPCTTRINDGPTDTEVHLNTIGRSRILSEVQRGASAEGCQVPTHFPAEQLQLWAFYTRAPRVFKAHSCLLTVMAVLEIGPRYE